jgi:hypothetical protein
VRTGHRAAGPRHPGGKLGDQHLVGVRRPDRGQVGRGPLVQPDQLVDLGAGQPATASHQVVEPGPLGLMRGGEDVDVHALI